ncbi:hypothetical protein BJ875DRAFT_438746 [Amylocarpus encephaloides]|uniref:Xylanolytic transcriptional activator regulatory domain-containing protein n=1 Tax=Amylocarpus encephaloides TaxID=45428 RepID=A0A9P7YPY1_9HELO|nr:hypothetical protein BJ875DRAFT_438746 [Amylocarpus encephaloides]
MASRLTKMERLMSEFGQTPSDDGNSPTMSEGNISEGLSKKEKHSIFKKNTIVDMPSPTEEGDFSWAIPEADPTCEQEIDKSDEWPCSMFSPKGVEWVNSMVGDDTYGRMVLSLTPVRKPREVEFDIINRVPLPSKDVLMECIRRYFTSMNRDVYLFSEETVVEGLRNYLAGRPNEGLGWYAAINIIVAQCIREHDDLKVILEARDDFNKFAYNTMSVIPSIILSPIDEMSIGALLCLGLFFMISNELKLAMPILAIAVRQMSMARFQHHIKPPKCSEASFQLRKRLFWAGYILDMDLSLRLGIAPLNSIDDPIPLPPPIPSDGIGMRVVSGTPFNFLREHVALAKIQSNVWSRLYSRRSLHQSPEQLWEIIEELDDELQKWKENVPEPLRPQTPLDELDQDNLLILTILHYTYFQLIIAVHSVVFHGHAAHNASDRDERIIGSVALSVASARASLTLLNYHKEGNPFTRFLANHVAWSVDILFMNILQNKASDKINKDLRLLEKLLQFYENHDPDMHTSISHQVTRIMFTVATRAVQKARNDVPVLSPELLMTGLAVNPEDNGFQPNMQNILLHPQHGFPSPQNDGSLSSGDLNNMGFMGSEWMMPLGFQPEYWHDPWANIFQEPDVSHQ